MAVDDAHVYWANERFSGDMIARANLDLTGVDKNFIGGVDAGDVTVDAGHIYFTNRTGLVSGIGRANLDGTGVDQSFIPGVDARGIAVDALRSSPLPPSPPTSPRPANEFSFGKLKRNKRKGTAKQTLGVPGPGELELARNKKLKGTEKRADAAGKEKLPIKPRRKARKRLNRRGKTKVKAKVTYTPDGGQPNTKIKKAKLKKR